MQKSYKPVPETDALRYKGTKDNPDIKIFVSNRIDTDSEAIKNDLYIPVRCGAIFDEKEKSEILGDDTGDNISEKRLSYCELTVQYWAYKNVEADYYGLCHYRRYLGFSDKHYPTGESERDNGCVFEKYIYDENTLEKHSLCSDKMADEIKKYDMIIAEPIKLKGYRSNYAAMKNSPDYHNMADVDFCTKTVKTKYPEMSKAVDEYMYRSKKSWLYNCWIMNKELFTRYSAWLFDILSEVEKNVDSEYYSQQMLRTPGTLGERLFGIFVTYIESLKKYKIAKKQLVFFENTKKEPETFPFSKENNVVITSNFNNRYVPTFSALLASIIENSSPENNYDIIVLIQDLTEESKKLLLSMIDKPNFSLRFVNPARYMDGLKMYVANREYTNDMYVRVLIPHILPNYDKILVLDADMICKTDVAKLYNTELNGNLAGAVKDVVYCGYLNGVVKGTLEYAKNTLALKNPYNYCNTGVLLFNAKAVRETYTLEYLQNYISTHEYRIYEQDTLNVLLDGKIEFLDRRWNMYTYTSEFIESCVKYAPYGEKEEYLEARLDPWIIHYAAHPKPWWTGGGDFANDFWYYARKCPYYEKIIAGMIGSNSGGEQSTKSALVTVFKRILPKFMHPLAKKIKRKLRW